MGTKLTFDIPAKRRERKKFKRFLKKTILKVKKPEEIKYLSLTGAEGLEILEVTDRLGILRENIVSCERNKILARQLKKTYPKISVVNDDITNYLQRTSRKYDVINLDFCGTMTSKVWGGMKHIVGRRLISDGGVVVCTFLGARENKDIQRMMRRSIASGRDILERMAKEAHNINDGSQFASEIFRTLKQQEMSITSKKMNDEIRRGMALKIITNCLGGRIQIMSRSESEKVHREIFDRWESLGKQEDYLPIHEAKKLNLTPDEWDAHMKRWDLRNRVSLEYDGIVPTRMEFYKYISDNGAPMLNLLFQFVYDETMYQRIGVLRWESYRFMIVSGADISRLPGAYSVPHFKLIKSPTVPKSVSIPKEIKCDIVKPTPVRKISRNMRRNIIKLLSQNIGSNEIAKKYDISKMQVAGIKAWMTRNNQ